MAQHRTRILTAGIASAALAGGLAVAALPQATAATHAAAPSNLNEQDQTYLHDSAQGDLFEVRGGRLAAHKADRSAVRKFGRMMVRDHTQSYDETKQLAASLGYDVPTTPSAGQHRVIKLWRSMDRHSFKCAYLPYEWEDHQLDISDAKDEIQNGQNPKVIDEAKKELPVLEQHLARATRVLEHPRGC